MTNEFKVGQIGVLGHQNQNGESTWEYIVIEKILDDRIIFLREYGGRFMVISSPSGNEDEIFSKRTYSYSMLKKNEEAVFSKKNIFGKYNFKFKAK